MLLLDSLLVFLVWKSLNNSTVIEYESSNMRALWIASSIKSNVLNVELVRIQRKWVWFDFWPQRPAK